MKNYWNIVKPTYIENWDKRLYSLSIPSIDVPLTVEDAEAIGSNMVELHELFGINNPLPISHIIDKVDNAIKQMPNGAFIRLGSRSPKDAWDIDPHIYDGKMAIQRILDVSERMADDLLLAIKHDYTPHIWVRQWVDIPKWSEFRCFMRNRNLVGISQYYYMDGKFKELQETYDSIAWAITQFFSIFVNYCHLDDIVFDVYIKQLVHGNENRYEVKLIEINPFFELTDPCLFNWAEKDQWNGEVKIL